MPDDETLPDNLLRNCYKTDDKRRGNTRLMCGGGGEGVGGDQVRVYAKKKKLFLISLRSGHRRFLKKSKTKLTARVLKKKKENQKTPLWFKCTLNYGNPSSI